MNNIKAIETVYKGYKFRSRLEARWAVFFDAAYITWEYEVEGFEDNEGNRYLPDFYLPDLDMYVEVKGERDGYKKELHKAVNFLKYGSPIKKLLVLGNIPEFQNEIPAFPIFYYDVFYQCPRAKYLPLLIHDDTYVDFADISSWGYADSCSFEEKVGTARQFRFLEYETKFESYYRDCFNGRIYELKSAYNQIGFVIDALERLNDCFKIARQARFEYKSEGE